MGTKHRGTGYRGMAGGLRLGQRVVALVAIALLTWGLGGCAKPIQPTELISEPTPQPNRLTGQIAEVSPPEALESLKQIIDAYTPQVRILSPRPGEIIKDTAATVRLQVRGLPLFKNDTYGLGPHLHLFLDGEPYRAVYDPSVPITFEGLAPGTHTLRVFASRPWHESFKNQGAFDQRTFHIYAPTPQNEVNAKAPLLTYSRPQGSYGAEPIMLDFYLTNAPLHISAQADASDDLHDWRIRCTVNDQSFVFDQWQPIWLKGFKPGRNWVQLELIDEGGNPIDNRFNNTVRAIDYQPGGTDGLSRLVRGELALEEVLGIIDPTYVSPAPEPATGPEDEASPEEVVPPASGPAQTLPVVPAPSPTVAPARAPEVNDAASPAPGERAAPANVPRPERAAPPEPPATADRPGGESRPASPNPFLLPERSLESSAPAAIAPGSEKTLIDEIEDVLEAAREEAKAELAVPAKPAAEPKAANVPTDVPAKTPAPPDPGVPTPEAPLAAPDRPAPETPKAAPEGLLNRFKQWRKSAQDPPPTSDRPAAPNPPDRFAAPQPSPVPEPAPALPRIEGVEPDATESFSTAPQPRTPAPPEPPVLEKPVELPRIGEPERSVPRSPIAPEVRPFI